MSNQPLGLINGIAFEALHSANDGITIVDMKQHDQPLIYVNPAFERLTGYPKQEILGKNCRFLQGNLPHQSEVALIHEALAKQQSCRLILQNVKKNGELFWNELSLAPIKEAKKAISLYVGIQKDVTQDVERCLGLTRSFETNKIMAMHETIAALAHEVNQPLSAIAIYSKSCHLMMYDNAEKESDKIGDVLEKIEIHALMIGEIIYRINNSFNEFILPRETVDMNNVIETTVSMLKFEANQSILLTLHRPLPPVYVTPMHMTQVILNLIRNSLEAFRRAGQRDGQITISTAKHRDSVLVTVTDNGPGMPPKFRNKDIGSFFTSKPYGVGTGLSLCKKLIELYGGTLAVQFTDPGLTVQCSLPRDGSQ